ncbi:MAG: PAS domain-containing protein [Desulfatiglandales bacterium]
MGALLESMTSRRIHTDLISLMLTHLPVDLTLVDENDRLAYYSQGKERIFPRSPGIIGREVQRCDPPEGVDVVNKILDEFKAGKKDTAEFWIQVEGKFVHIRYLALRSPDGSYTGCLEVSQDITEIRQLVGERRLLMDWEH